jgi:hypothetical protein
MRIMRARPSVAVAAIGMIGEDLAQAGRIAAAPVREGLVADPVPVARVQEAADRVHRDAAAPAGPEVIDVPGQEALVDRVARMIGAAHSIPIAHHLRHLLRPMSGSSFFPNRAVPKASQNR